MGLDIPELDDKGYEDIQDEAVKLIPAYSDEWTDYNPNDPGIAIVETLAWLTSTYTYQIDHVDDTHRQKYLKLMDSQPESPTPASVRLSVDPPENADGCVIPAGEGLTVVDGSGTDKTFETDSAVALTDASVDRVVTEQGRTLSDHSHANDTEGMFYRAFGDRAPEGSALYLGLDADPFDAENTLSIVVDYHTENLPEPAAHGDEQQAFDPSVELVWEYCSVYQDWRSDDAWVPLSVERDGTNGFYESGTVTLEQPDCWDPEAWGASDVGLADQPPGLVWLRCRVERGGYEIPPQFNSISLNVIGATHRATVEDEQLTRPRDNLGAENLSEQAYEFEHAPVLEAEVTVGGERWTEVDDFDASGPTDQHYVLDATEGRVRFGDGVRGELPDPDKEVVAERYVYGGGEEGNVPASSNWGFSDAGKDVGGGVTLASVSLTPEESATGGSDAESIEAAFRREKRDLKVSYRAVTPEDYQYVATSTPGLRFGRATVLVESVEGPGDERYTEVGVVVVPYAPPDLARPEPSEGFLEAVQAHLDKHRLLTDRVTARAPTYVGLEVEVEVRSARGHLEPRGDDAIGSAIREYIDPIHGYEGEGWPFGRTLYRDELYDAIDGIEWVDNVREVEITARGNAAVDGDGNVLIDDDALFYLEDLSTTIQTDESSGNVGR